MRATGRCTGQDTRSSSDSPAAAVAPLKQEGVSLIELMVTLAVLALALGLSIPSFTALRANNRMTTAANDIVTSLHAARSEAIMRQVTVTMCPTPAGDGACVDGGSVGAGWTVFVDRNGDGQISPDDVVLQRHPGLEPELRAGLTTAPANSPGYVAFAGSGALGTDTLSRPLTDLQLCDARGDVDTGGGIAAGRWIQIHRTGRPELQRTRDDLQKRSVLGGC